MKKIIFMAVAAAFTFSSCDDFLDSTDYENANTGNFPTIPADVEKELTGAYSILNQYVNTPLQTPYYVWNLMSDDCNGAGGTGDVESHAVGHMTANKEDLYDAAWKDTYMGIARANTIIHTIDVMDWTGKESTRNQLLGEAYFLRGLYYLWGAQFWGNIPAYWDEVIPEPCPQQDAETVIYPHILADFVSAAALMNQKTQGDGHATRYAAEAMLARAYMFYQGFYKKAGELANATLADVELPEQEGVNGSLTKAQVVAALKDVVDNGGYSLISDFRCLWQYTNSLTVEDYDYTKGQNLVWAGNGNSEQIFQVQFMNISSWNGNVAMGYNNQLSLYSGLRCDEGIDASGNKVANGDLNTFPFGQGWGQGTVNAQLWSDWADSDPRKKASILDAPAECTNFVYTSSCSEDAGYYNKKLLPVTCSKTKWDEHGAAYTWWSCLQDGYTNTNGNSFQGDHYQDLVLVRYADVLLMLTELTGDATYMNQVRTRAGLGTTTYSWQNIKNERRFELAFEGVRFNDLRRWSGIHGGESCEAAVAIERKNGTPVNYTGEWKKMVHATSSWAKRYAETDGFLMIPPTQIQLVGDETVLKQNAGWGTSDANMPGTPVYTEAAKDPRN